MKVNKIPTRVRPFKPKHNLYFQFGKMALLFTLGGFVLLDIEDVPLVKRFHWCVDLANDEYVISNEPGTNKRVYLHRILLSPPPGMLVDHINHHPWDNRRSCNIRVVDPSTNQLNRKKANINSKSGVLGVYWNKRRNKWTAQIIINGKNHYVGLFDDINEAIKARAAKLKQLLTA
jgi:hypothetical protein